MSLDDRAREATASLRDSIDHELDPIAMLRSVRRTRARRRVALVAAPLALATLVAGAVWAGTRPEHPAPVSRPQVVLHTNGVLVGTDNPELSHADEMHLPPLAEWSTPTWSPDGREIAVLAGGILITNVETGAERLLPCPGCAQIAWAPDGTRFAAVDNSGDGIVLVDASSGLMSHAWVRSVKNLRSLSWSSDGTRVAFVADGRVQGSRVRRGAFVADLDHGGVRVVLAGPLSQTNGDTNPTRVLAVSWNPTRDRIAVLTATVGPGGWTHPAELGVESVSPSGGGMAALASDGSCVCVGWSPNLTWSPDGTTLAVYAAHDGDRQTLDGDGSRVHVLFVKGSGPLAWQPR